MRAVISGMTEAIRVCGVWMSKSPEGTGLFAARLQPEADSDAGVPAKPGIPIRRRYLLIAEPGAFEPGEDCTQLYHGDAVYEVLRLEPVHLGEQIAHWEGTVKLKTGGAVHD